MSLFNRRRLSLDIHGVIARVACPVLSLAVQRLLPLAHIGQLALALVAEHAPYRSSLGARLLESDDLFDIWGLIPLVECFRLQPNIGEVDQSLRRLDCQALLSGNN